MGVKILSLFDGMACGMIAMQFAGVEVESYDAYEIDKYAIKTAQHNFPMIKEHGDVFDADFTQYEGVDFLVGGSPCTYWSIAQTKNRETVASGMGWELFSQYVRALHEAKPKYFIYENNKSMSKQIRASIDDAFGFEAVLINSALVSAQNRQRLYWVGKRNADGTYSKVNVEQPADRGILLKDVLDNAVARDLTCNDKSYALTASYDGACAWNTIERHQRNMVAEPVACRCRGRVDASGNGYAKYECREDGKSNTLDTNTTNGAMVAEPVKVGYVGNGGQGNRVYSVNGKAVAQSGGMGSNTGLYAEPILKDFPPFVDERIDNIVEKVVHYPEMWNPYNNAEITEKAPTQTTQCASWTSSSTCVIAEPINATADGKAQCLRATCYKDGIRNIIANEVDKKTGVAEPINVPHDCDVVITENSIRCQRRDQKHSTVQGSHVNFTDGKTQTLSPSHIPNVIEPKSCGGFGEKTGLYAIPYEIKFDDDGRPIKAVNADGKEITIYEVRDGKITIKGKQYPIKLKDGFYIIRKLTVSECKRLQTVPEWYEFPVSNSQAYKMLGNGWTCEVICHLINSCFKPTDVLPGQIGLW